MPHAVREYVHGIFQRQRLFIEALAPLFDEVHCVFWKGLGPGNLDDLATVRHRAEEVFGRPVSVEVLPSGNRGAGGYFDYYGRSLVLGPAAQPYRRTMGRAELARLQAALPADADLIFAQGLDVMAGLAHVARRDTGPVIWDMNDLETLKFVRELAIAPWSKGKPLLYLQAAGLFSQERRAARAARLGFVCSDLDRRRAERALGARFLTAPNAVEVGESPLPLPDGQPTLLFVGFMGYEPNRDAADWLAEAVWPLIRRSLPQARLVIAGGRQERLRIFQASPAGIEIMGFVPDLQPLYAQAHLVVCPIRSGSGTRVKLLEAGAYGRPIVSTRLGAEGLDFTDGRDIAFADDPESFARACVDLLQDRARAERMALAAYRTIAARYGRDAVIALIRQAVQGELERRPA